MEGAGTAGILPEIGGAPQLVQLGATLHSWKEEIATIWRFTRNNGITEGFHNKIETTRQAYGFCLRKLQAARQSIMWLIALGSGLPPSLAQN
jgi:transposase